MSQDLNENYKKKILKRTVSSILKILVRNIRIINQNYRCDMLIRNITQKEY